MKDKMHALYIRDKLAGGNGQVIEDEFLFVVACNTRSTGKGMEPAPDAEIGDGKVNVALVRRASRRQMLKLFKRVSHRSYRSLHCVEHDRARSFRIESAGVDLPNLDGEFKGSTSASAEITPPALQDFA